MMQRWALGGSLAGALAAGVACAPAQWLTRSVEQLSQQRVVLQQVRGTVWSGSAQLVLSAGVGSQQAVALPDRLTWRLSPSLLPRPSLGVSLSLPCCTPTPLSLQAQADWSGTRVRVLDQHSTWPAAALAGLGTPWNTVQAQGQLHLETRALDIRWAERRWQVAGQATLSLIDLSSRLSPLRPMGSYRLQLQGSQGATPMQVQLETLNGLLQLQGRGEWIGERWRFEGEASTDPAHEAALSNLLNVLGRRQGNKAQLTMG
jgi:general secretion pathway protein N